MHYIDHSSSKDRVVQEPGKLTYKVNIDVKIAVDARIELTSSTPQNHISK